MSETAVTPPSSTTALGPPVEAPVQPRPSRPPSRWKRQIAEFFLIVVGVLVALSADALREAYAERQRAATYLSDLETDMTTMLNMVDRSIAFDDRHLVRTTAMVEYLQSTARLSEDSVKALRGLAWSGFVPINGTIRALFETGELRVMSPGLRRSLTAYLTDQENADREIGRASVDAMQAALLIRDREEPHRRYRGSRADTTTWDYTLDVERMRADPQLRAAYITGFVRLRDRVGHLRNFRVSVTGLQEVIAAEKAR
jgi:hypothetical protein